MSATAVAAPAAKGKKNNTLIIIGIVILLIIIAITLWYFLSYKPKQEELKKLPTSSAGLSSGAKWNNNGKIEIVP